jgi:[acyl-carrier-protein] S-malonyltransferase
MIAFTFPGQGSQQPAMGAPWTDHPSWELITEASSVSGRDVAHLLLDAGADELTETRNAQLAVFSLSLVILDAVERLGVVPARLAGHSLGEYTALTASGALAFEEGIRLVVERGSAMQSAAEENPGTMAAVLGLDDDQVEIACMGTEGDVWVANFNAPGNVVIAGACDAVERAGLVAKRLGATESVELQVSGAFHTPFMAPARDRLRKALSEADLRDPDIPVMANLDAMPHVDAADWEGLLGAQLCSPVRWRQTLHNLADQGVTQFVEIGPGAQLTSMVKSTEKQAAHLSVDVPDDLDRLLAALAGHADSEGNTDEGEQIFMAERMIVSPSAGVFTPLNGIGPGDVVDVGEVVGTVGDVEVRSPFGGSVMGLLAMSGERVQISQPIAWLRTA